MRSSWAQPSLSRDFVLLSAAILFTLSIISAVVTYTTYMTHTERITLELEKESTRIEHALGAEMQNAIYTLTALGKQIVLDPNRDLTRLAQVLKSFDNKEYIYSILSWVNPDQLLVVSSNKGVLDKPVDISDRDYVKKSFADPWKMSIGRPIEGRVSGRWVIPVSMGITDYTGKFIGTIMISIDINMLTDRISSMVKRDGWSFAIVSRTLIPLTQVSDERDFFSNNSPVQKLVNVNFSQNPTGLVSQANMFWNSGSYTFYRVSRDYPYIILLGYDPRFSDEAVRSLLWWRLLQVGAMAVFFVSFLWIVRVRMIKPVMEMTAIATAVAKGEACATLPRGGPIEIEALAMQIRRVSEYIEETKRIQEELRNKMFMLKKAKEQADIERRSQSEFMAYVCQEMRTPLNNIIGGAQVMKDQLYGPLENRKYRQYAADIYTTGNILMDSTQDLLTLAKSETDYIELVEKPVEIAGAINKALRFLSDKMQAEKLGIKVQLQEPMPRLIADEFRLQQILMNLLLHSLRHALPESTILLEAKLITEGRDKMFFAFIISSSGHSNYTSSDLIAIAERLLQSPQHRPSSKVAELLKDQTDVSLELAKTLVGLHQGVIDIGQSADGAITIVAFFGGNRVRFAETQDK